MGRYYQVSEFCYRNGIKISHSDIMSPTRFSKDGIDYYKGYFDIVDRPLRVISELKKIFGIEEKTSHCDTFSEKKC